MTPQRLAATVATLIALVFSAKPLAAQPVDVTRLSGTYRGDQVMKQAGDCRIDGGKRSTRSARLVLMVEPDGTFVAGEVRSTRAIKHDWRGRIAPDLTVTVDVQARATCRGESREYQI